MWSRGLLAGLVVVLMPFRRGVTPTVIGASNSQVTINQSSHGCTGSQTVTARNGDNLTVLVENHVSGSTRRTGCERRCRHERHRHRNVIHATSSSVFRATYPTASHSRGWRSNESLATSYDGTADVAKVQLSSCRSVP
jgi:hypothetical protein